MQILKVLTNHQETNVQRKLNDTVICWRMKKTSRNVKTPPGEF